MTTGPAPTIRSEEERQAVFHLRSALFWRVKLQLQQLPSVTPQQFQEMVRIAVWDAQAIAAEIANLYPALDALQKVGWRASDAFDRAVPPQPASASAPQGGTPNRPGSELDNFGKELDKGFKEIGGAIDGFLGGKKKT